MADEANLIKNMAAPFADGRPSVLGLIRSAAAKRTDDAARLEIHLPRDNGEEEPDRRIRFVAGGLDAILGRPDQSAKQIKARTLVAAITKLLRHPSPTALSATYSLLRQGQANSTVDETLERLAPQL